MKADLRDYCGVMAAAARTVGDLTTFGDMADQFLPVLVKSTTSYLVMCSQWSIAVGSRAQWQYIHWYWLRVSSPRPAVM